GGDQVLEGGTLVTAMDELDGLVRMKPVVILRDDLELAIDAGREPVGRQHDLEPRERQNADNERNEQEETLAHLDILGQFGGDRMYNVAVESVGKVKVVISDCHLSAGRFYEGRLNPHEDFHFDDEMVDLFEHFSSGQYGEGPGGPVEVELIIAGDYL